MNFNNQVFNPQFMNEQYYQSVKAQIDMYNQQQDESVYKTVKAFHDFIEASNKLDPTHQEIAAYGCLAELAKMNGWIY